jgi:hypothetical protein
MRASAAIPAGMSQPSQIVERLLVHAELCQRLASECWNEELAEKLMRLARAAFDAARLASQAETGCVVPISESPVPQSLKVDPARRL